MKSSLAAILFALITPSCATLFSGTHQMLSVRSEPPGAKVYFDEEYKGETPVAFEIKRKLASYGLTLKRDGHPDYHATLQDKFNPVSVLNLGFFPGWGIDMLSGALMKYDEQVFYRLEAPTEKAAVDPFAPSARGPNDAPPSRSGATS